MGIHPTLEKCLRQLNPNIVLQNKLGEAHRVKTRSKYLNKDILTRYAKIRTDIYNGGRLEINVLADVGRAIRLLSQKPLTDFRKKYF